MLVKSQKQEQWRSASTFRELEILLYISWSDLSGPSILMSIYGEVSYIIWKIERWSDQFRLQTELMCKLLKKKKKMLILYLQQS